MSTEITVQPQVLLTPKNSTRGFTLLELLLTITIIAILAGLLLGPVSRAMKKARDADWTNKADVKVERLINHLRAHYRKQHVASRLTPEQLRHLEVIDEELLDFINDERVAYVPFSSTDSDDKIILQIDYPKSFLSGPEHIRAVRKERITGD